MCTLGRCLRTAAAQTTIGHCLAILEGGYELQTLRSIVPAFLVSLGIPGRVSTEEAEDEKEARPDAMETETSSEYGSETDSEDDVSRFFRSRFV
jgi:acetoin utilization deacetylase AcuC-like enzyme